MRQIVLPERYYLSHFLEFIEFLRAHALDCCDREHLTWLEEFEGLSDDAKCLYLRVANRRGRVFHGPSFRYAEISDHEAAAVELKRRGFLLSPGPAELTEALESLDKARLFALARDVGCQVAKSWNCDRLIATLAAAEWNGRDATFLGECIQQGRTEELEYLKFLFFGELHENLGLYTLRDLGVRRANTLGKSKYVARFASAAEAKSHYAYARIAERLAHLDSPAARAALAAERATWPEPLNAQARQLREEILCELGEALAKDARADEALATLAACSAHPGTERYARLLYKLGRKDECQTLLEQMIDASTCEAELVFASDFLQRKYQKKRTHILTDLLNEAPAIALDESYRETAEQGVQSHFRAMGFSAYRTENYLWSALFGLVFWDALFESDEAAICSPFDRRPQNLIGGDFYAKHEVAIHAALERLGSPEGAISEIRRTIAEKSGRLNDIFQWHGSLERVLPAFLTAAPPAAVREVLLAMARDFEAHHSGFPDLVVIDHDGVRFVEVKAEGDSLRPNQLRQLRLLRTAGFRVEILRVVWRVDPDQTYVVVDVETTGSVAHGHRVTEIGAVKVRGDQVIDVYSTLINPGRRIPCFITELTGITDAMVANAPRFDEIAPAFAEFLEGSVFVAHNVRFDYSFIQAEFERAGYEYIARKFCTVTGMRRSFPGFKSYGLKNLCVELGIGLDSHHRALCDAQAAAALLIRINQKRNEDARAAVGAAPTTAAVGAAPTTAAVGA